ncbi:hypothetical protein BJY04DRAFT_223164 [Aspergillus karnatakaensis]|uniref:uncharacterized protein n=1 Tax=Aspergillus karnatakaensis TaxID=1810916 RepID=UPI003CCD18D0
MLSSDFLSRLFRFAPRHRKRTRNNPQRHQNEQHSASPETRQVVSIERINTTPYMSRAILESPGIYPSTCAINGDIHDPERLPILPPNHVSLYSKLTDENNHDYTADLNAQSGSSFFTKLPPEIRQMIYIHAFGARRIHLDYDFNVQENSQRWIWWHRVCDDASNCPDKEYACPETVAAEASMLRLGSDKWVKTGFEYKVGAVGWLCSCKTAYEETIPALYSSNTFVLTQGIDQLSRITKVLPDSHLALLTSLHVEIDVYRICGYSPPDMNSLFAHFYKTTFELLDDRLPSLRGLMLSFAGMPRSIYSAGVWRTVDEENWIGPWEELARGRQWRRLEIVVPDATFEVFEELVRRRREVDGDGNGNGRSGYVVVKGTESYQKGWS